MSASALRDPVGELASGSPGKDASELMARAGSLEQAPGRVGLQVHGRAFDTLQKKISKSTPSP